jgi:hypothetical protein
MKKISKTLYPSRIQQENNPSICKKTAEPPAIANWMHCSSISGDNKPSRRKSECPT